MANSLLTPTAVTREALRILHEKLSFIGTINRQYDDSFAKMGAKIGDSLKIRLPNQYTVRTGKTLSAQDTTETSVTLQVATQKGVDMSFSSAELTMTIDDFSSRILEPAMAVLASNVEADALQTMTKDVYNHIGTPGTDPTFAQINQARARLNQNLAPKDSNRHIQMESVDMASVMDEVKTLFHDPKQLSKQYREGYISSAAGLSWTENERVYTHTPGADVAWAINQSSTAPAEGDTTFTIDAASAAPVVGDIFTIAGVKGVHPETKDTMPHEQQFVVTSSTTPTTTAISFSPALEAAGANQNIDHLPSDNDVLTAVGSASTAYPNHLVYHKDAFSFATADLIMPTGVDFADRQSYDGISIRMVRDYAISSDTFPCRIDILYGYKTLRASNAVRMFGKGT